VNESPNRRAWREEALDDRTRAILDDDERHYIRQSLSTPCLNALTGCEGIYLTDVQGRRIMDFHGNSVHQVGYAHPRVIAAIKRQLDELSFCPRRYANQTAIDLAARLCGLAPGGPWKVLLTTGGSAAVGVAIKLARCATGRFKTVSMWDSFHGASLDAISIGGEALFRRGIGPLLPGAEHVPPPAPEGCPFIGAGVRVARNGVSRCGEGCALRCARYVEYVLEKEGDVAAVIAEPMRATTAVPPPPGYWEIVRKACDRHGALLVFDEIPTCMGRTGRMFCYEHFGAIPDILVIGKGLGGGVFPIAAVIARAELDVAPEKSLGHYTHEKNPVAAAAALATLDVIEQEGLLERTRQLGERALLRLKEMQTRHFLISDARGLGLLIGVELRRDGAKATEEADRMLYECLRRGLSFKVSDGNVLTLCPPLTITQSELDEALDILEDALAAVES